MATKPSKVKNKGRNKGHDNLIPIKKGERLNPNGRPAGVRDFKTIYKEAMQTLADVNKTTPQALENEMIANAAKLARRGNVQFYKDTMDRLHGRAVDRRELTGKDGGAILVTTEQKEAITDALDDIV